MRLCNSTGLLDQHVLGELALELSDDGIVATGSHDVPAGDDELASARSDELSPAHVMIQNWFTYILVRVEQKILPLLSVEKKWPQRNGKNTHLLPAKHGMRHRNTKSILCSASTCGYLYSSYSTSAERRVASMGLHRKVPQQSHVLNGGLAGLTSASRVTIGSPLRMSLGA